jgi:hypothetical protein
MLSHIRQSSVGLKSMKDNINRKTLLYMLRVVQ